MKTEYSALFDRVHYSKSRSVMSTLTAYLSMINLNGGQRIVHLGLEGVMGVVGEWGVRVRRTMGVCW